MNSDAIARLKNLAREAASDWREDNDYGDIEDVAHDLAGGIRWSAEGNDWKEGVKHYGGETALVSALAETMAG
jgi:hypothetical protein